jgi:hypothetical protein
MPHWAYCALIEHVKSNNEQLDENEEKGKTKKKRERNKIVPICRTGLLGVLSLGSPYWASH